MGALVARQPGGPGAEARRRKSRRKTMAEEFSEGLGEEGRGGSRDRPGGGRRAGKGGVGERTAPEGVGVRSETHHGLCFGGTWGEGEGGGGEERWRWRCDRKIGCKRAERNGLEGELKNYDGGSSYCVCRNGGG